MKIPTWEKARSTMKTKDSLFISAIALAYCLAFTSVAQAQDRATPNGATSPQTAKSWTIKPAKVVAREMLNTGTLVTVQFPLNDPDGVKGEVILASQSPFIVSQERVSPVLERLDARVSERQPASPFASPHTCEHRDRDIR